MIQFKTMHYLILVKLPIYNSELSLKQELFKDGFDYNKVAKALQELQSQGILVCGCDCPFIFLSKRLILKHRHYLFTQKGCKFFHQMIKLKPFIVYDAKSRTNTPKNNQDKKCFAQNRKSDQQAQRK